MKAERGTETVEVLPLGQARLEVVASCTSASERPVASASSLTATGLDSFRATRPEMRPTTTRPSTT